MTSLLIQVDSHRPYSRLTATSNVRSRIHEKLQVSLKRQIAKRPMKCRPSNISIRTGLNPPAQYRASLPSVHMADLASLENPVATVLCGAGFHLRRRVQGKAPQWVKIRVERGGSKPRETHGLDPGKGFKGMCFQPQAMKRIMPCFPSPSDASTLRDVAPQWEESASAHGSKRAMLTRSLGFGDALNVKTADGPSTGNVSAVSRSAVQEDGVFESAESTEIWAEAGAGVHSPRTSRATCRRRPR